MSDLYHLNDIPEDLRQYFEPARCTHPTLKPLQLVEYLSRLALPPPHIGERRLLVPFAGVGSEMIGARLAGWDVVTGIERDAEYIPQGEARLAWWSQFDTYEQAERAYSGERHEATQATNGQLSIYDLLPE